MEFPLPWSLNTFGYGYRHAGFLQSSTLPTALASVPLPSSSSPSNKRFDPNLTTFSLSDYERRTDLNERRYVIWIRHHEEEFVGVKIKSMDGCHALFYSVISPYVSLPLDVLCIGRD